MSEILEKFKGTTLQYLVKTSEALKVLVDELRTYEAYP